MKEGSSQPPGLLVWSLAGDMAMRAGQERGTGGGTAWAKAGELGSGKVCSP